MGAGATAAPARAHRGGPLTVVPYEQALELSGGDEFVRWHIDPVRTPEAWVYGAAVAFERLTRSGRRSLTVVGPVAAAAECVRALLPRRQPARVTVPRGTLALLDGEVRVGDGAEWEWLVADVPPVVDPVAAQRVTALGADDYADIADLLAVASPRHSADPGDDDVVQWVGVRDPAGALVACAAHTEAISGVPHLASITTHPSVRGQGLGSLVTGAVTRDLLLGGAPVVTLGMYSDNEIARRLYLRLGFRCHHHWSSYGILLR